MSAADFLHGDAGAAERQTILDAIPAIAWCKSPDGSNEFVNQRWQEYTGIPAEEARGHGWQKAVTPKTGAPAKPAVPSRSLAGDLAQREKAVIESALREARGVIGGATGAAAKLGIPRQTLESKLRKLGIDRYRFKTS